MSSSLACLALLICGVPQPLETLCVQVAPAGLEKQEFARSKDQERAVVLIHGLTLRPFSKDAGKKAALKEWQEANSALVKKLGQEADVFAFAYGQTISADNISEVADLGVWLGQLRELGYKEIVLIGHSAGGLIAREFVEDNPDSGVTKVIQVCTPNEGSTWATVRAVHAGQADFMRSLTKDTRLRIERARSDKRIPDDVEFVCVVGDLSLIGDVVVTCKSQWSEDLQKQGVPVYPVAATHWHVLYSKTVIEKLAELVRAPQPRWNAEKVATMKKKLIGMARRSENASLI